MATYIREDSLLGAVQASPATHRDECEMPIGLEETHTYRFSTVLDEKQSMLITADHTDSRAGLARSGVASTYIQTNGTPERGIVGETPKQT